MGIFDRMKKDKALAIAACADGMVVPMENIPDPAFSGGILGFCAGIEPDGGDIFAPADGVISQLSETLHAVGIQTDDGVELLVHVGIDTVAMGGEGFSPAVKAGDRVKTGQFLLRADLEQIRSAGHPVTVVTAIPESDGYTAVIPAASGRIRRVETLLEIRR